jgi:hypothetical protein
MQQAISGAEPAVVQQLRSDLVGKDFAIALPVAGSTCLQTPGMSFATSRLVDTEVDRNGGVAYYLRTDRFMNIRRCTQAAGSLPDTTLGGMHVDVEYITNMHQTGSVMTVKTVQAKPDRIEMELKMQGSSGDEAYGKLKFMLGTGYASQNLEQIENILLSGIVIPRIAALNSARSQFNGIRSAISSLQNDLANEHRAQHRIEKASQLIALYRREPDAVALLNSVAFDPVPVPLDSLALEGAENTLADARKQLLREQSDAAIQQYSSAVAEMKRSCERVQDLPVSNRVELNRQLAVVEFARQSVSLFEDARKQMISLAQTAAREDEAYSTRCGSSASTLSQSFPAKLEKVLQVETAEANAERERQARLNELNQQQERTRQINSCTEDYRQMKKQKAELDARLLQVLGRDQEAVFDEYRRLLTGMIQNRQRAASLGMHAAEKEMEVLADELRKIDGTR